MINALHGDIDISQLKQNWKGEWDVGTIYRRNDTVSINGRMYVCINDDLKENLRFGPSTKPDINSTNWLAISQGSKMRGQWAIHQYWQQGDIVKYNGDMYQCLVDHYDGHPIYENGALTNKWILTAKSARENKHKNHIWFGNYPPMGWTRNCGETNEMYGNAGSNRIATINGKYQMTFLGMKHGGHQGGGIGETSNWNVGGSPDYTCSMYTHGMTAAFDFWDYKDNYRPSITGEPPRVIQYTSNLNHNLVLFDNGEVYHIGYGGHGQSGDGTTSTYHYARRVGRTGGRGTGVLRDVHVIKVGQSTKGGDGTDLDTHSCFVISDTGKVWTWGYNGYGQLGHGNTSNYSVPTQIPQHWFHNKKIVDGWMYGVDYQSTVFQTEDGDLYFCGYAGYGGGTGNTGYNYRPEIIKYDWQKFGGIKKVIAFGDGSHNSINVLTHDGNLHNTGYMSNGSYSWTGAGATRTTWIAHMRPLIDTFRANANALGIGRKDKHLTSLINMAGQVEDFWINYRITSGQGHLVMKEKDTGLMYSVGRYNGVVASYDVHKMVNEHSGDNPVGTNPGGVAFPVPVVTGPMTDICYVACGGSDDGATFLYLNRDGRTWTNGYDGGYAGRGIGHWTSNPDDFFRKNQTLPFEVYFSDYTPVMPRFQENVTMVQPQTEGTSNGFFFIADNNRIVGTTNQSWYYGFDVVFSSARSGGYLGGYTSFNF